MFAKADVILPNYTVTNQNYVAFFFVFLPICGIFHGVLHHCDGKRKHASPKTTIYITSIGQVTLCTKKICARGLGFEPGISHNDPVMRCRIVVK